MSRSPGRAEIAVVGGGIAGASAAYHLARAGRDVALLERGEIASEASGINAGSIGALGWGRIPDLQATLTTGSLEIFRSLELDLEQDIEFRQSGALQAIQTEAQYEFARDQVQALRADGYTVELLSIREARSIEPAMSPELLGAVHSPLRAQADPKKATRAFAQVAAAAGARSSPVTRCSRWRRRPRVPDRHPARRAPRGHARDRGGGVVRRGGAHARLRHPDRPRARPDVGQRPRPPVHVPGHLVHGVRARLAPSSGRRRRRAARADAQEGRADHAPPLRPPDPHRRDHLRRRPRGGRLRHHTGSLGVEENKRHAGEVLPFLGGLPVRRTWAGLMPFPLDGEPIIGRIPALPDLFIVTGLASSGFGRGPMAGQLIAEYVHTGQRPMVLAEADPARCVVPAGDRPTGEPHATRAPAKRLSVSGSRRKTR